MTAGHLVLTGERTLPGIWHENYWFRRHEAAYRWVCRTFADELASSRVLDAGCGEGFGAGLLGSAGAACVLALDLDAATVAHVARTYPSVRPLRANLVALPLRDGAVDALVSLQTVEHLWDQATFVAECARVVRPGGPVVVTTPNRTTFSPGSDGSGAALNPFHAHELDAAELRGLLAARLDDVVVLGLHHAPRLEHHEAADGPLVERLLAFPHPRWDAGLAALVASVSADDFAVVDHDVAAVEASLDLVGVGRAR